MHALLMKADTDMGRPKKPPTSQVRLPNEVVDLAYKRAAEHGYRGAVGDYLGDLLKPILASDELSRPRPVETTPVKKTKGAK